MDVRCCCGQPGSDQTQGPALAETPESPRPTEGVRAKDGCSPLLTRLELLMAGSGVTVVPREPQPGLAWGRCSSAGGMREVSLGPSVWDGGLESRCGRQPEVGRGRAVLHRPAYGICAGEAWPGTQVSEGTCGLADVEARVLLMHHQAPFRQQCA